MPSSILSFEHLAKRYGQTAALSDVSFDVPGGEIFGLLGPNGAGKSTLIRILMDIIRADAGEVRVFGEPRRREHLDRLGYLPEERGLYTKQTVIDVMMYFGSLKGLDRAEARRRALAWLEKVELPQVAAWKIDRLSKGMSQKVQFIGTLLHDPDLVILDEPFSGLDPINAQALKDTVVELRKRGKTVIFSTHLMDNAERLCDSVCIIARGEKVLDGSVSGVKSAHGARHIALGLNGDASSTVTSVLSDTTLVTRVDDQNQFYELELAPGASPQRLLERLVAAGAPITRFELVQPSLHQIFLQTVGAEGVEEGMSGQG